jgi:hypothetical protein
VRMLPREQLTSLRERIADLEQRSAVLREVIRDIEEEIALQEALRDLAQNEKLVEMVGEVQDNPKLASSLARAPQQYFEDKGVRLPENVTLNAVAADESVERLTANLRVGSRNVEVGWDRESGFFARALRPYGLAWLPPPSDVETTT